MEGNAQVTWQAIRYVERILCGAGVAYLAGYAQAMSAAAAGLSGLSAGGSSAAVAGLSAGGSSAAAAGLSAVAGNRQVM